MSIIEYEDRIRELVKNEDHSNFIYDFLEIYGISKSTITKLKKGTVNLASNGDIYLKNKVYFINTNNGLEEQIEKIKLKFKDNKSKPRYIIVTDFNKFLANDTKTAESLKFDFEKLPQYFDFFLGWKGIEKVDYEKENPADLKAAERFAKIYDILLKDNPNISRHAFNIFLIRLLFCLFAEDTGIFEENLFTNYIKSFSSEDASDLNLCIKELFKILDIKEEKRSNEISSTLKKFSYVNGQLFTEEHSNIVFSKKSRDLIIDAGELLDWNKINPDILGSMLQAVSKEDSRSHLGMHYTSVPNIMKVIRPLFLDDLEEEFNNSKGNIEKLNKLLTRIGNIKFMDPACGSGNFLVIAYKELRKLEMKILNEQQKLDPSIFYVPTVKLSQFYGMEIDDFATDVARLSLWIADHQMNKVLQDKYGDVLRPTLPLQQVGKIKCTNALREDWEKFLPCNFANEIYIFGNPPYMGAKRQNEEQKEDLKISTRDLKYKKLDYVSGWFVKAVEFLANKNCKVGYVTTNSINQGEQVDLLWPKLLINSEIFYAYKSFDWENNAKNNAGVTVNIIGLCPPKMSEKKLLFYSDKTVKSVKNISPYLTENSNLTIKSRRKNFDINLPKAYLGCLPLDNGNLILNQNERDKLLDATPSLASVIKKYLGSKDFVQGNTRFVLWMNKEQYEIYKNIPEVNERVRKVRIYRENGGISARKSADTPFKFYTRQARDNAIQESKMSNPNNEMLTLIIPRVTTSSRLYIPMGLVGEDTIVSDSTTAIYNSPVWLMGILESKLHMIWLKNIGGRLRNGFRYSADIVYNTFPFPQLSTQKKNKIEELTWKILDIREEEEGNIEDLYGSPLASKNPKPMNERLKKAHEELDRVVERAYRTAPFKDDDERLSFLLKMYEEKRNEEN